MATTVNELLQKAVEHAREAEQNRDPVSASLADTWATLALVYTLNNHGTAVQKNTKAVDEVTSAAKVLSGWFDDTNKIMGAKLRALTNEIESLPEKITQRRS